MGAGVGATVGGLECFDLAEGHRLRRKLANGIAVGCRDATAVADDDAPRAPRLAVVPDAPDVAAAVPASPEEVPGPSTPASEETSALEGSAHLRDLLLDALDFVRRAAGEIHVEKHACG